MVEIKLLTSPGCSACKASKDKIKNVLSKFKDLNVKEIDILEHPDVVIKYNIMSTPVIVIDEKVAFTGVPDEDELKKRINKALKEEG